MYYVYIHTHTQERDACELLEVLTCRYFKSQTHLSQLEVQNALRSSRQEATIIGNFSYHAEQRARHGVVAAISIVSAPWIIILFLFPPRLFFKAQAAKAVDSTTKDAAIAATAAFL